MRREHSKALKEVARDLLRLGQSAVHRKQVGDVARAFLARADRPLKQIGPSEVREYLAARSKTGISRTTQAGELSRLRSFYTALLRLGLATEDPTAQVVVERSEPPIHLLVSESSVRKLFEAALDPDARQYVSGCIRRARPGITEEELEAVRSASAKRDRAALELLYGLGLRSAEARAARVADLDMAEGTLLVRRAKRGDPERLPLPPAAIPHVVAWLEVRPLLARGEDEGRLLVMNDGKPYGRASYVNKLVARVAKRAGVRVHPHALRRGIATHLVRAGTPLPIVQQLLGHKCLDTTAIYVGVERTDLRRAIQALERPE